MFARGLIGLCLISLIADSAVAEPGATQIAKWRDNRTAVFLLMFDDSWPSHFQVAVPELAKRGLTGTFYINPGKGEYKKFAQEWEEKVWKQGMAYGNHTMTHQGANDLDEARREISECTQVILKTVPGPKPRLISWGMPGVKVWNVTAEQLTEILAAEHLIDRPPFRDHGAVYHLKTADEMLALVDKAVRAQSMEYLVFHGIERIEPKWGYQDFWALKQDIFLPVLDALKQRQEKGELWITDHISYHQYEQERAAARVKVAKASDQELVIELTATTDPKFYDLPLTLLSDVPAGWTQAQVTQGKTVTTVPVTAGRVQYSALPNGGPVKITPAR